QRAVMMKAFLQELLENYANKQVLIIGHRVTQYGIEAMVSGRPLTQIASEPWQRQPGWFYKLS
ncbi:MAG TPA: hypothetical protein VFT87_01895, partial [Candidatus Saccharimonadales bacterium]|nr:hypothetical protein [Candidatus Saccharimonadales bacterium]